MKDDIIRQFHEQSFGRTIDWDLDNTIPRHNNILTRRKIILKLHSHSWLLYWNLKRSNKNKNNKRIITLS